MMGGRRVWFLGPERNTESQAVLGRARASKRLIPKRLSSGLGAGWVYEACWSGPRNSPDLCWGFAQAPWARG